MPYALTVRRGGRTTESRCLCDPPSPAHLQDQDTLSSDLQAPTAAQAGKLPTTPDASVPLAGWLTLPIPLSGPFGLSGSPHPGPLSQGEGAWSMLRSLASSLGPLGYKPEVVGGEEGTQGTGGVAPMPCSLLWLGHRATVPRPVLVQLCHQGWLEVIRPQGGWPSTHTLDLMPLWHRCKR